MKRIIYDKLIEWKKSDRRKPLILRGARQIGKTYILKKFAEKEYENYVYVNFEKKSELVDILNEDLSVEKIIERISIFTGEEIIPEKTLIFFDEIQASPNILRSLKYFNEDFNEYHVVSAGSLLGIILSGKISFPVGKVNFLDMYPLSFEEFVIALGKERFLATIPKNFNQILSNKIKSDSFIFHESLVEMLKLYYFIGGMPEVIADYIEHKNFKRVRLIQNELIETYLNDFSKHTTKNEAMKIRQVWDSIPLHLGKENKTFIFSAIKSSGRARDYEIAMQWLLDAGLIIKIHNISLPLIPLNAYVKPQFKIYLIDVGLLGAMTNLPQKSIIIGDELFTHFKGSLVENFVFQEITKTVKPYYWSNENKAKIDLIIEYNGDIYPVEVKSGINLKAKSLKVYDKLFSPKILLRSSISSFNKGDRIIDIPLYALSSVFT